MSELTFAQHGDRISGSISLNLRRGAREGWVKSEADIQIAPGESFAQAVSRLAASCAGGLPALTEELVTAMEKENSK